MMKFRLGQLVKLDRYSDTTGMITNIRLGLDDPMARKDTLSDRPDLRADLERRLLALHMNDASRCRRCLDREPEVNGLFRGMLNALLGYAVIGLVVYLIYWSA